MEVIYHNRSTVADAGVPARAVGFAEVMAADFVVVAVPGGAATHHLINAEVLGFMKESGTFVNISRGDVVDETALVRVLQEGRIAGAGLDVYEFEPKVPEALAQLENVTLLPHLGTACLEVREAMGMLAVQNLIAFAEGQDPPNLLTA
jgi:gluconate 2-dehydrogenase